MLASFHNTITAETKYTYPKTSLNRMNDLQRAIIKPDDIGDEKSFGILRIISTRLNNPINEKTNSEMPRKTLSCNLTRYFKNVLRIISTYPVFLQKIKKVV